MVDTCAAEFEAATPYFYSTYGGEENEASPSERPKVIILGSGPNRIGQGIEFDYANVHAVWALQEEGHEVIMVNSNPETVSTDYDASDRLYFEPLTDEDVLSIIKNESVGKEDVFAGVVVGFGGQTPLKLARTLVKEGIPLLGTSFDMIEMAENREAFGALLDKLDLKSPPYGTATTVEGALAVAEKLGYPVLVRPSYVLGGRAMEIVDSAQELQHYVDEAARVSPGYPVLIDRFLEDALEMDVDILTDGENVWVAGLMEQIEEAGVHSGDSACVLPPVSLWDAMIGRIEQAAYGIVTEMGAIGLVNIQMAIKGNDLYIIEANPRASRTVPYVSKAIGIPVAKLAAKVLIGKKLDELLTPYWPFSVRPGSPYTDGNLIEILSKTHMAPTPWPDHSSVKEVVLPFRRFPGTDARLGPEMRSTGEVMSFGASFPEAFAKAQLAAGNPLPTEGSVLVTLADTDKRPGTSLVAQLSDMGFDIVATRGTARVLKAMGIPVQEVAKVGEGRPDCVDLISQGHIDLVVNTPSSTQAERVVASQPVPHAAKERGLPLHLAGKRSVGYQIRTSTIDHHVPYVTSLVALRAAVAAIKALHSGKLPVRALQEIA
jgi:carbamoyl-phosphate synthase large subunit